MVWAKIYLIPWHQILQRKHSTDANKKTLNKLIINAKDQAIVLSERPIRQPQNTLHHLTVCAGTGRGVDA